MIRKDLFLRYALPCANTLIERGETTKDEIEKMKKILQKGEEISNDAIKKFKVAYAFCKELGKKLNKNPMDEEVIRKYFWFEHDYLVDLMGADIDCKVYPARIEKIENKKAFVITPIGKMECKIELIKNLKKNDWVTIHRKYVVEKISEKDAKLLWKIKEMEASR